MQGRLGRRPAQLVAGQRGGRDQLGRVALAAGGHLDRNRLPGDLADHVDDLPVGEAVAVAQVVDPVPARRGRVQREQVGAGQVFDVDVVADAGAVDCGVVVAEELELLPPSGGHVERDGDEVGLRVVPLADGQPVAQVRPGDVEVAQRDGGQVVRDRLGGERHVDGQLGGAVGAGGGLDGGLRDGQLGRVAVDGGGGGEDHPGHPGGADRVDERDRADRVGVPVQLGADHRLAGGDQGGEVQHAVEARVGGEHPGGLVHRQLDVGGVGGEGLPVTGAQVVQHGHLVAVVEQHPGHHAADVAGAAGDEQFHVGPPAWAASRGGRPVITLRPGAVSRLSS